MCHCFLIAIAKLHKIRGMLRTKVDEIGCYCRKNMIFSIFSRKTLTENLVRPGKPIPHISRPHTAKTKKTRGTDQNPAQPRPETNSAYRLASQKYKKKATKPKTSQYRPLLDKNDKYLKTTPKKAHNPTKQYQRKNISSFPGPTMRMESVPEGTPSLPFFKNDGVTN